MSIEIDGRRIQRLIEHIWASIESFSDDEFETDNGDLISALSFVMAEVVLDSEIVPGHDAATEAQAAVALAISMLKTGNHLGRPQ